MKAELCCDLHIDKSMSEDIKVKKKQEIDSLHGTVASSFDQVQKCTKTVS